MDAYRRLCLSAGHFSIMDHPFNGILYPSPRACQGCQLRWIILVLGHQCEQFYDYHSNPDSHGHFAQWRRELDCGHNPKCHLDNDWNSTVSN